MARRRLLNRRVFITGASGGIGRALAIALADQGARLMINARRETRLNALAEELAARQVDVTVAAGDISSPAVRTRIAESIGQRWGAIDLLINNAGIGAIGPFGESNTDRLARVFDVNFFAPVELTRTLIPLLQCGTDPVIVNVGSVLGHVAAPYKSEYCASKFALLGFSNSLRMELRASGIAVLVISPSTTASEFFDRAMRNLSEAEVATPLSRRAMSVEYVADRIVKAIESRKRELYLPPISRWVLPILQACPALADWLAMRWSPKSTEPKAAEP